MEHHMGFHRFMLARSALPAFALMACVGGSSIVTAKAIHAKAIFVTGK
jgi:hypothetical protein